MIYKGENILLRQQCTDDKFRESELSMALYMLHLRYFWLSGTGFSHYVTPAASSAVLKLYFFWKDGQKKDCCTLCHQVQHLACWNSDGIMWFCCRLLLPTWLYQKKQACSSATHTHLTNMWSKEIGINQINCVCICLIMIHPQLIRWSHVGATSANMTDLFFVLFFSATDDYSTIFKTYPKGERREYVGLLFFLFFYVLWTIMLADMLTPATNTHTHAIINSRSLQNY